ncbi:TraB/GumN family protein [Cerasicoccus fimbriatus]|uniref:TraB/GumN family protein n=1 Tax=Cerasicoccus fimbriatus TaxID=3014554 RepID=UPI0022B56FFF|nr:TraB/GumN family protein [Cerasicoccus sp. TK19100]
MIFYKHVRALMTVLAMSALSSALADNSMGSYLFSISKEGYATSYLFGTIHLPDKRVTELPKNVIDTYRKVDAVYTEIPMEAEEMLGAAQSMMLPNGNTLKDVLPPETLAGFERELKAINPQFTAEPFMALKIWAAASTLMMLETQLKNPGVNAMDMALYMGAKKGGKRVGGIESAAEQMALFDAFSDEEQIALMDSMLDYMQEMREQGEGYTDEMIDAYLSGDLKKLEEMMASYEMEDEALQAKFEKLFIEDRNVLMAVRIERIMAQNLDQSEFFAVGAAHLYGPGGVPALLRDAGFDIQRVK